MYCFECSESFLPIHFSIFSYIQETEIAQYTIAWILLMDTWFFHNALSCTTITAGKDHFKFDLNY